MSRQPCLVAGPEDSVSRLLVERLSASTVEEATVVYRPQLCAQGERPNLEAAEAFFETLAADGTRRLVLLSSAAALDPNHHNTGYLCEAHRPAGRNPIARAWLDLEALAAARLPHLERIVLRPAPVIAADGADFFSRLLRDRRRRITAMPPGYDPTIQLLTPEDLAGAVHAAVTQGAGRPGTYHVAPAGALPLRRALRLAGVRCLPFGLTGGGGRLDYLRHNWTVSGAKIERELGFTPRSTSAAAVRPGSDQVFDDFGLDLDYIAGYERTLFRFLHDVYWRIEVQGVENVPREGRAVLTGVHRGFMPWDGVMALVAVKRAVGRVPRFLIHPCLIKPPFLADYMTKLGGIVASAENADRVLSGGGLLGMFPEGIHGAFTMYRDAYKLGKFGRDEYVKMALRNRAPIIPFVTVGSAEIYPIWGRLDWKWVKRATEWLFLPVGPNFPFPGLPLPSKWHTRFLEPIPLQEAYGPEAADDPAVVRAISGDVRARMQTALDEMLARRRSIFFGSIFSPRSPEARA
jgi:1-acyl-sn-glycerol-3-phosphate acyltransferase/nucleoside-diphosphate-sugar epimerase